MLVRTNDVFQGQLNGFPQLPALIVPQYVQLQRQYYAAVPAPEPGLSFGTFLAGLTTAIGGAVMFDPKASKEAKAVAQMALGVSVPFLLNKAFEQNAWPQWN